MDALVVTARLLQLAVRLPAGEPMGVTRRELAVYMRWLWLGSGRPVGEADAMSTFRGFTGHRLVIIDEDWARRLDQ